MKLLLTLVLICLLTACTTPVCTTVQGGSINGTLNGVTFHQGNGDILTVCAPSVTTSLSRPATPASAP